MSPSKNLNPSLEYSILKPVHHNISENMPPLQPGITPRKLTDLFLPDIDEISPSYDTHRHSSTSQQQIRHMSTPSSVRLDIASTVQEEVCLSLQRFASKYAERLPLSIQIQSGSYHEKLFQVSKADIFTVHFIAMQQVVSFKDTANNDTYILPLTAVSEFGITHASQWSNSECTEFETIKDILDAAILPRVVCARRSFQGNNAKSSVEINEILIIQKAKKMNKVLKVYSITAGMKKCLSSKCKGLFTTTPESIKLSIQKIYEHLFDLLPVKVVAFPQNQELPSHLIDKEVTVMGHHAKDSLIVSPVNTRSSEGQLFSIPIDAAIEVMVIPSFGQMSNLSARLAQHAEEERPNEIEDYITPDSVRLEALRVQQKCLSTLTARPQRRPHIYESLDYISMEPNVANHLSTTPNQTQMRSDFTRSPPTTRVELHDDDDDNDDDEDEDVSDYTYVDCQYRAPGLTQAAPNICPQGNALDRHNTSLSLSSDGSKEAVQDETFERGRKENQAFIATLKEQQVTSSLLDYTLILVVSKDNEMTTCCKNNNTLKIKPLSERICLYFASMLYASETRIMILLSPGAPLRDACLFLIVWVTCLMAEI